MGYGPVINNKQQPITPRNGGNWMDLVNKPKTEEDTLHQYTKARTLKGLSFSHREELPF